MAKVPYVYPRTVGLDFAHSPTNHAWSVGEGNPHHIVELPSQVFTYIDERSISAFLFE